MKKLLSLLTVFSLGVLILASCSKDDDPRDSNLFLGKYEGKITYIKGLEKISNNNGTVTVAKFGDKYKFKFSDGIPSIEEELDEDDNGLSLELDDGVSIISINKSTLRIVMAKDGAMWTANCKRK